MPQIRAIFFDQDGVIIDTERDGHRVAFNQTFAHFGIRAVWDERLYHQLLQVGGGKERMRHYFNKHGWPETDDRDGLIRQLHEHKTRVFVEMIEQQKLPLRPGVHRIMREANQAGMKLGICTTSNEKTATAIAKGYLADVRSDFILAGDVVPKKKPDPAIYHLALERAGVPAEAALVFEDSHIGVTAARAAGCRVVATANGYTQDEDLDAADLLLTSLGDATSPARLLRAGETFAGGTPSLQDLLAAVAPEQGGPG